MFVYETFFFDQEDPDRDRTLVIEYRMVDEGIGPYEYWGIPGVDRRIEPEIVSIRIDGREAEELPAHIDERELYRKLAWEAKKQL